MKTTLSALLLLGNFAFAQGAPDLKSEVAELRSLVQKLQSRVDQLEARAQAAGPPAAPAGAAAVAPHPSNTAAPADTLAGTTVNFVLDGYYGYNFNSPIGRANLLRAYDVSSNSFSLNQAAVVIENAADPARGKRWGARLDLQFGQATETLQGNSANEMRPSIYRHVFQAYGTYVFPVGGGLTVDVGKWASALGFENNYTKDQFNYSRSYWFNYLPFYHMGLRTSYKANSWLTVNYWLANGAQQVEDFNGAKDQFFGVGVQTKKVSWNANYYLGQEHADFTYAPSITGNFSQSPRDIIPIGAPQSVPVPFQQGSPFFPIRPAPDGRLHILDTYLSWQASPKLTLALEGDYTIQRLFRDSAPARVSGGAAYGRYQRTPRFAIAGRAEYLSDRAGAFSGSTQALKEFTITLEHKLADGFLLREEWRRDFSNQAYFLSDRLGVLKRQQNTATVGLVWWFGAKQGPW